MKIYNFDLEHGEKIEKLNSNFIFSKIVHLNAEAKISCFYLDSNGIVGHHQAITPQLFLVVQGNGWGNLWENSNCPISSRILGQK